MTEITPARMRELADQTNAATAKAFDAVKAVEYHSDEAQTLALCGNLLAKLYPALRAAADQQERDAATLAARDALLGRAYRYVWGYVTQDDLGYEDVARALAAEIAAALGAGIPPNTDDVKEKDNG